jgi:ubiquitin C-terminal hydrolase
VGTQQTSTDFAMFDLTVIPAQLTPHQMWMRECPKCKTIIEKEHSSDAWRCFWCG